MVVVLTIDNSTSYLSSFACFSEKSQNKKTEIKSLARAETHHSTNKFPYEKLFPVKQNNHYDDG
jgi:hypothetical protein